MAKEKKETPSSTARPALSDPWISRRSGLILMTVLSTGVAVWMFFQGNANVSLGERLLWSLVFGANVWLVFGLVFLLNRFLRR